MSYSLKDCIFCTNNQNIILTLVTQTPPSLIVSLVTYRNLCTYPSAENENATVNINYIKNENRCLWMHFQKPVQLVFDCALSQKEKKITLLVALNLVKFNRVLFYHNRSGTEFSPVTINH